MLGSIKEFRDFCFHRHDVYVNQKYGKNDSLPYSFHLDSVECQGFRFRHLLSNRDWQIARCGLSGHDLGEDGRMSYNDIKHRTDKEIANIIWGVTDSSGRTRDERHDEAYWSRLNGNRVSVFVKLSDRIANMLYSLMTGSTMFDKYKREWPEMKLRLKDHYIEFREMFDYIEKIQEL